MQHSLQIIRILPRGLRPPERLHGYRIERWNPQSLCGGGGSNSCTFIAPQTDVHLVVVLRPVAYTLTVEPAGAGTIVSGDASGGGNVIACTRAVTGELEGSCSARWLPGTAVTLKLSPSRAARFRRWSVWECPGRQLSCTVVMDSDRTVIALMDRVSLTVRRIGTGGRVTSAPHGINCGANCEQATATFAFGTNLALTATTEPGVAFGGWSDPCGGTNSICTLHLVSSAAVAATFGSLGTPTAPPLRLASRPQPAAAAIQPAPTYTINLTVSGGGVIQLALPSGNGSIRCRPRCSRGGYLASRPAEIRAIANRHWKLSRWYYGCGHHPSCRIDAYTNSDVRAVFRRR
jgi:Divergent InlB B-repeat domain